MKNLIVTTLAFFLLSLAHSQEIIPLDTTNWEISGNYLFENFRGKDAIYLKSGNIKLKDRTFLNGTIEFDLFLKEAPMFPGIYFRAVDLDAEQFYVRPHLSGKPDANQAVPLVNGISPWQLYFGPKYSFPYTYNYDDWTHVKLVVNEDKAQVYLDHAPQPNLSWRLTMPIRPGDILLRGGGQEAIHIANVTIDENATDLKDFAPVERAVIQDLIDEWSISDKFDEATLEDPGQLKDIIAQRSWNKKIQVEEGTAANISRQQIRFNGNPGNTVFARIDINSELEQIKFFEFGYSDRVVVIINDEPIYRGTNRWRSRDYRYLGTVGLFDGVYLNLKKGNNTLLMAVSEDFGGWLITGKFKDQDGITINPKIP